MCLNQLDKNKARYKSIKNQTTKAVANSMRKETKKELTKVSENPYIIFIPGRVRKKKAKLLKEEDA